MELNVYKLNVKSDLYEIYYTIRATSLQEAGKLAKVKFAKRFHVFGDDVKVSLEPNDLPNHIDEILNVLHKS